MALLRERGDLVAARARVEAGLARDAAAGDLHREAGLLDFAGGNDASAVAHFERMGEAADFDALLLWAQAVEASRGGAGD